MKKRNVFRSVAALALAIVLLLAMALPALAASGGSGSITIDPNGQGKLGGADRFTAYQIFSGTVGSDPNELDGLEWGSGVNSATLVGLMKESSLALEGSTFGKVFGDAWDVWKAQYENQMSEAEFVAQWLGQHLSDPAYADDFARLVSVCTTTSGTQSDFNVGETAWVIENLDPGYYLVKDNYVSQSGSDESDGSVSSYILQVLGQVQVDLKATIPTVEKKVDGVKGVLTETETEHTFTLTGTVAENIGEYGKYSYKFTDTISKGLTVTEAQQSGLTVTYRNGSSPIREFTKGTDYEVTYLPSGSDGAHVLTVTFLNLKQSLKDRVQGIDLSNTTLVKGINIVVTYKAQLNENAVIGDDGNPNDVILEYSNNPYSTGKGETVPDVVNTYTLALRIVKQDVDNNPLDGVEFKLMKGNNNDPNAGNNQFATFKQGTGEAGIGQSQQETFQEISGWVTGGVDSAGNVLTTDKDGVFNIHGLADGIYTLVETKAPEGYETMKPIVFTITGTVDDNGALTVATMTVADSGTRKDVALNNGSLLAHNAQMTLTNFKSPILPHTGGTGAKVIYIVSALVVLAGVTVLFAATRKRSGGGRHAAGRR